MIPIEQLINNLKAYILEQLDVLSGDTPIIGLIKPLITRVLDKNVCKVTTLAGLIADDNGNIDIEGILSEMLENLTTSKPFLFKTTIAGDIEIGSGHIKFNIPFTDKKLMLDITDLEKMKEVLTSK